MLQTIIAAFVALIVSVSGAIGTGASQLSIALGNALLPIPATSVSYARTPRASQSAAAVIATLSNSTQNVATSTTRTTLQTGFQQPLDLLRDGRPGACRSSVRWGSCSCEGPQDTHCVIDRRQGETVTVVSAAVVSHVIEFNCTISVRATSSMASASAGVRAVRDRSSSSMAVARSKSGSASASVVVASMRGLRSCHSRASSLSDPAAAVLLALGSAARTGKGVRPVTCASGRISAVAGLLSSSGTDVPLHPPRLQAVSRAGRPTLYPQIMPLAFERQKTPRRWVRALRQRRGVAVASRQALNEAISLQRARRVGAKQVINDWPQYRDEGIDRRARKGAVPNKVPIDEKAE
jgi:hypothetical protein